MDSTAIDPTARGETRVNGHRWAVSAVRRQARRGHGNGATTPARLARVATGRSIDRIATPMCASSTITRRSSGLAGTSGTGFPGLAGRATRASVNLKASARTAPREIRPRWPPRYAHPVKDPM